VSNSSLNFRLPDEQFAALQEISKKNGVKVSQLARWAVDALIRQVEQNQGRLTLPIDFASERAKPKSAK
jgi:predicted site-specific integrase-resolvase